MSFCAPLTTAAAWKRVEVLLRTLTKHSCNKETTARRTFHSQYNTHCQKQQQTLKMDEGLFVGKPDRFKGVTVRSEEEPCSSEEFKQKLEKSLAEWKARGVRGLWFYVNIAQSDWIPILAANGFDFHHAKTGSVGMIKWLPENEANQIPPYAHHMVGVGGMVVNDKDEILVVQEKYAAFRQWKLPGGYVDPGEDLSTAAVREIREETGVETEFDSIVSFRHAHGFNFGCSDIYVIVCLRPLTSDIRHCDREISECRWMPIKEFVKHDMVHDTNRHFALKFLENREAGVKIARHEIELKFKEFRRMQQVYSVSKSAKEEDNKKEGE